MDQRHRDLAKISKIILHCSDSDIEGHDDISVIRRWHIKERGFDDVGYHFFIRKNYLEPQIGRQLTTIGAHCKGHNSDSIGICLSGKHEFKPAQFEIAGILILELAKDLGWTSLEDRIFGHNHFDSKKTCPNFDIRLITGLIPHCAF